MSKFTAPTPNEKNKILKPELPAEPLTGDFEKHKREQSNKTTDELLANLEWWDLTGLQEFLEWDVASMILGLNYLWITNFRDRELTDEIKKTLDQVRPAFFTADALKYFKDKIWDKRGKIFIPVEISPITKIYRYICENITQKDSNWKPIKWKLIQKLDFIKSFRYGTFAFLYDIYNSLVEPENKLREIDFITNFSRNLEEIYCDTNYWLWKSPQQVNEKLITILKETKKLKELTLQQFDLTYIPPEIFNLKTLKVLDLNYNKINSLPDEISKLENLEELNIYDNPLHYFSPKILELKKLKRLIISTNFPNNEAILENLDKLESLEEVYLRGSELKKIPESVYRAKKLRRLSINLGELSREQEKVLESKLPWIDLELVDL